MAKLLPSMLSVAVTSWPDHGPAKVITRSWNDNLNPGSYFGRDLPLIENPSDYVRLHLDNVVPADPGWIAATAHLIGTFGQPLCDRRPVRFYGRPSEVGTHIYFPSNGYDGAHSVELRIVHGGISDDD